MTSGKKHRLFLGIEISLIAAISIFTVNKIFNNKQPTPLEIVRENHLETELFVGSAIDQDSFQTLQDLSEDFKSKSIIGKISLQGIENYNGLKESLHQTDSITPVQFNKISYFIGGQLNKNGISRDEAIALCDSEFDLVIFSREVTEKEVSLGIINYSPDLDSLIQGWNASNKA